MMVRVCRRKPPSGRNLKDLVPSAKVSDDSDHHTLLRPLAQGARRSITGSMSSILKTREEVLQGFTDSPEFQISVDALIAAGCL